MANYSVTATDDTGASSTVEFAFPGAHPISRDLVAIMEQLDAGYRTLQTIEVKA